MLKSSFIFQCALNKIIEDSESTWGQVFRLQIGTRNIAFSATFFFHEFIVPRKSLSKISDRSPCKFSQREGIFKKRAKLKWRVVELVNCKSALRSNLRLAQIYFKFKCSSEIQVSKLFYFGFHTLQWHFSKEFDTAVFTDRITKLRIILPWNQLSLTSFSIVLLQKRKSGKNCRSIPTNLKE